MLHTRDVTEEEFRLREVLTRWGQVLVAKGLLSVEDFLDAYRGPGPIVAQPSADLIHRLRDLESPHRMISAL